ncbi:MAG TPA: SAM-dependent chlorinase/fluorinase [Terriglobia bacterium]|nr:SAM-dependent chlorinase/fluorinase [Terriglobia bacterium]
MITLTTDFGWRDPYVGIMKGVILGLAPGASIIDLTHGISSHNVLEAALVLECSYRYFPEGTIHLVVVDPGVGTERRPLLATTGRYSFVGPDNGVFSPVLSRESPYRIYHLTKQRYFLDRLSSTFHGRDIFAPVAAWLFQGASPAQMGEEISSMVELRIPEVKQVACNLWAARVLRVDRFGNLITNIGRPEFETVLEPRTSFQVRFGQHTVTRLRESYGVAPSGEIFAIWGSSGWLEISSNQASAAELMGVRENQEFTIEILSTP